MEYSTQRVTFLDVDTYRHCNSIFTTLHIKPMDSHSYLDYSSCHPKSVKSGIPYRQFIRIRRNCTEWTEFVKFSLQLFMYFSNRGYPHNLLEESLLKVNKLTQFDAMHSQQKKRGDTKNFYCITEYNPSHPDIRKIFSEYWPLLDRSSSTRSLLASNIIFGHSKPKNLSNYLVKSDYMSDCNIGTKRIPPKCNKLGRCKHCPLLNKTGFIVSSSTTRKYKIPKRVTCNSQNVIYCLQCNNCSSQYVGQTKNKFLIRVNQHLGDIRHNRDTPVARHYQKQTDGMILNVLQIIKKDDQSLRDKWENYWISRLNTLTPKGLNILDWNEHLQ